MATDTKKMWDNMLIAFNSHDVNKIVAFYTDDCIYENLATGTVTHGKKEITDYINSLFVDIPDLKMEHKSVFGAGDWVGEEWVLSGTHTNSIRSLPGVAATGKIVSVRGATIYQLREGKISRQSEYFNLATLLQQIGLLPMQSK
jgi:steroid delta-isomerase-like uncharacterized protein